MAAPMIRQMAQRLSRSLPKGVASIDWNDLASAGFIGLLDALDKYDAHLNVPFLSFARFRVRGAMIDAMRNNDHLKRTKRTRMRLVHRAVNQLTQELDNSPTRQQVADRLGVSIRDVEEAMSPVVLLSLNAPGRNDDGTDGSPAEIADAGRSPEDLYYSRQRQLSVREAIQKRHSRERQIIQMIYDEGMDQYEAATVLGISPSRVSQLHAAALEKLQRLPAGSGLQQRTVRKTHAFFTQARKAA